MRHEFPKGIKVAAFQRSKGRCERCTALLYPGKFEYDHRLADTFGGEPTLDNCMVLCIACHDAKTYSSDIPAAAKSNRVRAKHIGAKSPSRTPLPFGRASKFKRKLDGSIVPRTRMEQDA
jgi:5-methylcytosine-specific restriction protein A